MPTFTGTPGDDVISGGATDDTINGLGGNDRLFGGEGTDTIDGGDDDDWLWSGQRDGTTDNGLDDITTPSGRDRLIGGAGNDVLSIGYADHADGGSGTDDLRISFGGAPSTALTGQGVFVFNTSTFVPGGTFTLFGGTISGMETLSYVRGSVGFRNAITVGTHAFTVTVVGGNANDVLTATGSSAILQGGDGNDILVSGSAADILDGGSGVNWVSYENAAGGVTVALSFTPGGTTVASDGDQITNFENLIGSGFGDQLTGNDDANTINGLAGNDTLTGNGGNDILNGGNGDDHLSGGGGNDTLTGDAGADTLVGGTGNDIYILADTLDTVTEAAGEGFDQIYVTSDYTIPTGIEIEYLAISGSAAAINLTGNEFGQQIFGNAGANVLAGGGGADTFAGLGGDDTYYLDSDDTVVEGSSNGIDTVYADFSFTLGAGASIEVLRLTDPNASFNLTGNAVAQKIYGNEGSNVLDDGGSANGTDDADELYGMGGNDTLIAHAGADLLFGGEGDDSLTGGAGADMLDGGNGTDIASYANAAAGVSLNLTTNSFGGDAQGDQFVSIERYELGAFADTFVGSSGNDFVNGLAGNDILVGNAGSDVLAGGLGDDVYVADSLDTIVEGAGQGCDQIYVAASFALNAGVEIEVVAVNDYGATIAINLTGNEFGQQLIGNAGDNVLNGGGGADTLFGGAGSDVYIVTTGDLIFSEGAGQGFDQAYASESFALNAGAAIEVISVNDRDATIAINLSGNEFNQQIYGNAGANVLAGGGGVDTLFGFGGNDVYVVDADDNLFESAGAGIDQVYVVASYALGAGIEIEVLSTLDYAATTAINLTGNEFGQQIFGNAGANVLAGGGGSDVLFGLAGNDVYIADANDVIVEAAGGGFDQVYVAASFALSGGAEIEVVSVNDYAATTAIDLTGNAFNQQLYGNAGDNALSGGGGVDTLIGYGGDDIYTADADDTILEAAGGGNDRVNVAASFVLSGGVEIETIAAANATATTALNITGNAFGQQILGNAGANVLSGGGGVDTLSGASGNDIYIADADDVIVEAAGGGFDQVYVAANFVLNAGAEIEIISVNDYAATAALNLTGNELGQQIIGNSGANVINGGGGADAIFGLGGNDSLTGGGGADSFCFTTLPGLGNVDQIEDFASGVDKIALDDAIFTGLTPGALPASAFVVGATAADADDRIIYDQATGRLYFDADGNGAGGAVQFATLTGSPAIVASDFQVI
jgi:Ca2+-binding RTX toxin-like protein